MTRREQNAKRRMKRAGKTPPSDWQIRQARVNLKQEAHMPRRMVNADNLQMLARILVKMLEDRETHDRKMQAEAAEAVQAIAEARDLNRRLNG